MKTETSTRKLLSKNSPKRMEWVDYARGLAIILVVYRHTMVGLERAAIDVPLFLYNIQEFLVNVRMPVFFVLSGIFLGRSINNKSKKVLIIKKAATLLYPYILWTIILITLQIFLSDYTNSKRSFSDYRYIITQPRELDHMWYLLALFNTSLLLIISSGWVLKRPVLHLLLATILHFAHLWLRDYSLFSDLCYYYIFLAIGVHVSNAVMELDKYDNKFILKVLLCALPLFITGQLAWFFNIDNNYAPFHESYIFPFLLIILTACVVFYCICRLLYNAGIAKWLNVIGRSSLHIYILHILIISSFRIVLIKIFNVSNVYILIGGSLVLGIGLPVLVYVISKKWKRIQILFSLEKVLSK